MNNTWIGAPLTTAECAASRERHWYWTREAVQTDDVARKVEGHTRLGQSSFNLTSQAGTDERTISMYCCIFHCNLHSPSRGLTALKCTCRSVD